MKSLLRFFLCVAISATNLIQAIPEAQPPLNSQQALQELMAGNERFMNDKMTHPNRSQERRDMVAVAQKPIAVIMGCSDSRVAPEIIFDQGLGDLFIVRTAGNVIGPIPTTSIEYGVAVLKAPLVLVLGHENCGAINAVLAGQTKDIEPVAKEIQQALRLKMLLSENPVENAVKLNIFSVVTQLREHELLRPFIQAGKLEVVGGYYRLESGKVEICCGMPTLSETAAKK